MTEPVRILVAVDGSTGSQRAVEYIRALDLGGRSRILILSVVEPLPRTNAASSPLTSARVRYLQVAYLAEQTQQAQGFVDRAASELRCADPTPETLVSVGKIGPRIVRIGQERQVDLIVLGSRGRGGFAGLLLGSVSQHVAERALSSVLVVKPPDEIPTASALRPRHLLVAVDASPASQATLEAVVRLPWSEPTQVQVLSVAGIDDAAPQAIIDAAREGAARVADQAACCLNARFPHVETDVSVGAPAKEIVDSARAWPADVIAVGSRNRHGVVALALGSISREVLLHAPCSVLIGRTLAPTLSPES